MDLLNQFLALTLGTLYTAATGKIDPWTAQRIRAQQKGK